MKFIFIQFPNTMAALNDTSASGKKYSLSNTIPLPFHSYKVLTIYIFIYDSSMKTYLRSFPVSPERPPANRVLSLMTIV